MGGDSQAGFEELVFIFIAILDAKLGSISDFNSKFGISLDDTLGRISEYNGQNEGLFLP